MKGKYEGSHIRTVRCPDNLDSRIDNFLEISGWDFSYLVRAALEEFFSRRSPGDHIAPQETKKSR